jgi:hypothetical protein
MHLFRVLMVISELIVCGSDEVFILELRDDAEPKKVWSWRGPDARFRYTAECKPVDGGRRIMIASSTDGVALVERASGRTEFIASVTNAHSAELLPGKRIAVAASHRGQTGDRLFVFDVADGRKPRFEAELPSGHGVVWDAGRNSLWALSGADVRRFRLRDSAIELVARYPLPDGGGHDLYPVPDTPHLAITTNGSCWLFDRDKLAFSPHPVLSGAKAVKSINVHPSTKQLVYVQADPGGWWSEWLRFAGPKREVRFAGIRLYKARWLPGASTSRPVRP